MLFQASLALLSCISASALAAPASSSASSSPSPEPSFVKIPTINTKNQNIKFTLPRKSVGTVPKDPLQQMLKPYKKYNKPVPASIKAAQSAQSTGSVTATPLAFDEAYLCPVTVGSTQMNLNFDTGSADLWVFSDLMKSSDQTGHDIYATSQGVKQNGQSWSIIYGDGSGASGQVFADKVVIGGVTATQQAVEAATSVSQAFIDDTQSDGLVGLAFSTINTIQPNPQKTFFDTVRNSLATPLFTANLKKGKAGSYDFGFIDSSKYSGNLIYVPVQTGNGFWEFTAGGFSVGKTKYSSPIGQAIADTGTTLMYIPPRLAAAYWAQVQGAQMSTSYGGWLYPCSSTLPDFTINIGSGSITIPGSYMNYGPVSYTTCFGGVQPNTNIGFTIFGDIFLKATFTVFDATNANAPRLGFAQST